MVIQSFFMKQFQGRRDIGVPGAQDSIYSSANLPLIYSLVSNPRWNPECTTYPKVEYHNNSCSPDIRMQQEYT